MVQIDNESGVQSVWYKRAVQASQNLGRHSYFLGCTNIWDFPPLPGEMTDEWKQLFDDNQVNIL
jgi:hypothetical protein